MSNSRTFGAIYVSVISIALFGSLYANNLKSAPNSYVFYFSNEYIRNDTQVRIEVTFDWQPENLSMIVTVNDDEYHEWDYLGVVFDKNHNGILDSKTERKSGVTWNFSYADEPYALYAYNKTRSQGTSALSETGGLVWPYIQSFPSHYHTCTFDEETGYTFKITLSRQDINVEPPTPVHICFFDEVWIDAMAREKLVWVQFVVK